VASWTYVASAAGGNCNTACTALGSTCEASKFPQSKAAIEAAYSEMGLGSCTASQRCDAGEVPLLGWSGSITGCYYCPDGLYSWVTNNCHSSAGTRIRMCPCKSTLAVSPPAPTAAPTAAAAGSSVD